jgi:cell division protein FtsQ
VNAPASLGRRIGSALAGAGAVALLAWAAWYGFAEVAAQPVKRVAFAGALDRLDPAELERLATAVRSAAAPSLESIHAAARRVPWVREASVRRLFPDAVEITFEVHEAFARWNDVELVSAAGDVFKAPGAGPLPQLRGPEGSAARVVREYVAVSAVLAPLGAAVAELRLSPRGGLHATLASGLGIALGRGDWRPRAERFVRAWPKLEPEARGARYADLRYPSGFALKRPAQVTVVSKP